LGLFQMEQQLINRHLVPKSQPKKPKHYCYGRGAALSERTPSSPVPRLRRRVLLVD
jgi:hypothetical protein